MKLNYKRINESDHIISIDLHNGYSIVALSGFNAATEHYMTTLLLKENSVDTWKLIEGARELEFKANYKTINSAVLKKVYELYKEGFFDYYIERYEYELKCFDIGNAKLEAERLSTDDKQ